MTTPEPIAPLTPYTPARTGGFRRLTFDNGRHEDYQAIYVQHPPTGEEWDRILIARDDGTLAALIVDAINEAAAAPPATVPEPERVLDPLAVSLVRPELLPGHNHDKDGLPTFPVFRVACPKGCDIEGEPWPPRFVVVKVGDLLDAAATSVPPPATVPDEGLVHRLMKAADSIKPEPGMDGPHGGYLGGVTRERASLAIEEAIAALSKPETGQELLDVDALAEAIHTFEHLDSEAACDAPALAAALAAKYAVARTRRLSTTDDKVGES